MKLLVRNLIAGWLAQQVKKLIRDKSLKVVGVTGSYGKTSTKLAIASVLGQKYAVLAHAGNYNTELGLPLSVFEEEVPKSLISPMQWLAVAGRVQQKAKNYPYKVLVLELGVDHPKDMDAFLRYLTPDIGVVTAVAGVHLENFLDVDEIADEKFKLALGSSKALLYTANPYIKTRADQLLEDYLSYGEASDNRFTATTLGPEGIEGTLKLDGAELDIKTHVIAEHSLRALEAAAVVGKELGLGEAQIQAGVQNFRPVNGRMNPLPGLNGSVIIDDSYNSSPEAAVAAVKTLAGFAGPRVAILGSMNELGDYAEKGHRLVGAEVAKAKIDLLVTIGEQARLYLADEALKTMKPKQVQSFDSPYEAGEFVKPLLTGKHIVLAKGSQNGVFAEEAVKLLLADPKDADKLVRQSAQWQSKKEAQFK